MKSSFLISLLIVVGLGFFISSNAQAVSKFSPTLEKVIAQQDENAIVKAWIYFTDKGANIASKLEAAQIDLTPRALKRRLRNRGADNLVDFKDIPVYKDYVSQVQALVQKIRHKSRWLNAVSVEAGGEALRQLEVLSFVKKIDIVREGKRRPLPEAERPTETQQLNGTLLNYGPSYDQNNQIHTIPLHNMGYDGSGVMVCMLDAGFNNLQHPAFSQLNILHTWDFVNGDAIVSDEPGQAGTGNHGTLTLSTLGGFDEGELIGPAYGADFILAKTENTDWERHIEEDHWVAGAEWGDSLGADIISSSLGYRDGFTHGEPDYTWQDMDGNTTIVTIGADIAASRGILVVNSAGNEGSAFPPENSLVAPSDGDSVACIGAVDASGNRAGFSSMGPTADGRTKPDVMARGVGTVCASPYSSGYTTASGTSLSCPLVAGAAALVLQANPTWTNMQILDALRNTADNASNPSNTYGWGIINTYDAANYSPTSIEGEEPALSKFELYPVYPNPFNPSTNIRFNLTAPGEIELAVYNNLGQEVETLARRYMNPGKHELSWNASDFSSGVYYVMLKANEGERIQKLLLIK